MESRTETEPTRVFTYRGARAPAVLTAIGAVLLIETIAIHLLLVTRHPVIAWGATGSSVSLLIWLVLDYRRFRDGAVLIEDEVVVLTIGLRFSIRIPCDNIASAIAPTWREVPPPGRSYLNAMKPATPNVLVSLRTPVTIRLLGVADRAVGQIGLCLDDPAPFIASFARRSG